MSDTRTFRVVDEDGDYYEITGDPLESLNAAYRERAHLVALLAAVYPAQFRENPDPDDEDWPIIYVQLPTGQASWHISPQDNDLFPHVRFGTEAEWDGHTTDEKYARIRHLTATTHAVAKHSAENAKVLKPLLAAGRRIADAASDSASERVRATLDHHAARGSSGGEYDDADIRAVLDNREVWRNLALSRSTEAR